MIVHYNFYYILCCR